MADRTEREVLHHLIEICRDGERGFRAAAHHVTAPTVSDLVEMQRNAIHAANDRIAAETGR